MKATGLVRFGVYSNKVEKQVITTDHRYNRIRAKTARRPPLDLWAHWIVDSILYHITAAWFVANNKERDSDTDRKSLLYIAEGIYEGTSDTYNGLVWFNRLPTNWENLEYYSRQGQCLEFYFKMENHEFAMKFNKIWQNLEFCLYNFLWPQKFGRQFNRLEI